MHFAGVSNSGIVEFLYYHPYLRAEIAILGRASNWTDATIRLNMVHVLCIMLPLQTYNCAYSTIPPQTPPRKYEMVH